MTVNRPNRVEVGPTLTVARDPLTGVQIRIGVMGSAGGALDESVAARCQDLGRAIAERGCCLLTGACPGLPHEVVCAAKHAGGHVVGISPASSLKEHVETFGSPYHEYDVLVFTGLGLMGRELVNIHSSFAWRAPFSEWKHAYIGTILEVTPTSDRMGGLPSCVIMLTADVLGAQGTSTPRRLTNVNAARSREQKTSR